MPRVPEGPKLRPNPKRNGTYYIYWTDPETGRSRERSTGTSEPGRAHEIFAEWLGRQKTAKWVGPRRPSEIQITEVLDFYIQGRIADIISKRTLRAAVKALLGWWGERTCDYIRPETCRAYVRERGAKQGTAARELIVLRAALGYSYKNGKMLERPFVEVPSPGPSRDRWLTRSEAARLLWASRKEPKCRGYLPLFILLGLTTGARTGALFDLRWNQVDFARNRIDFNVPGRKQSNKRRPIVPIPRRLRWFLLRAHARASTPYVLSYQGRRLKTVDRSFRSACARAGLGREVLAYTLRHTAATWMAQQGVELWQIAGWLGHTMQTTTERYGHHSPEYLGKAKRVMD